MLRRALTIFTFTGGLFWLLLLVVARVGTRPRPWPIELLDTFALYGFAPFLALVLIAPLLRSRLLLGLLAAAGLLFWHQFGQALLPKPVPAAASGVQVRILAYNKFFDNRDARPLAELVLSVVPDVVVVEELTGGYADGLARLLGGRYPFSVAGDGSGIFSRLPILDPRAFRLRTGGYGLHHVRLVVGDRPVSLFSVHLRSPQLRTEELEEALPPLVRGFGAPARELELERLIDEVAAVPDPFILAGDFNIPAGSRPYRRFPTRWRDAFGERGSGFGHTWPTGRSAWGGRLAVPFPLVRIDYVLSSPELVPERAWVPWIDGSDHLPVVAELQLSAAR
jgi:vancomycin resistance protein VanJ